MPYWDGNVYRDDNGKDITHLYYNSWNIGNIMAEIGAIGLIFVLSILAVIVFLASNIFYIIVLSIILIAGTVINKGLKLQGKSLLIRLPVKLLTLILVLAGLIWIIWDKSHGIVPAIRGNAIVESENSAFRYLFSIDDMVADLKQGDTVSILGVSRNGKYFKIKTQSGDVGYTHASYMQDYKDYVFHKQGFWDRMMEFSFSPREYPLIPGRYESSKGDLVLILDRAKEKHFEVYIIDESNTSGREIRRGISYLYIDKSDTENWREGGAVFFSLKINKNKSPVEFNGGLYNYTISIDLKNTSFRNEPEVVPFLHYLGDYVITSNSSFVKEGIEWKLVLQKDNSMFQ
ncbi:MAG: hypothetical protein LBU88_08915 [Treponema sp.]|jgi:hypothetical protein|nr:hypothetical protein [Treponema sp.]